MKPSSNQPTAKQPGSPEPTPEIRFGIDNPSGKANFPAAGDEIVESIGSEKLNQEGTIDSQVYAQAIAETVQESILVLDDDLRVVAVNNSFLETFRVPRGEAEGRFLFELGDGQWNVPSLLNLLRGIPPQRVGVKNFVVRCKFAHIGTRVMSLNASRIKRQNGAKGRMILAIEDVTEKTRTLEEYKKQSELLHLAHDGIIVRDLESVILFWNRGAQEMYGWSAGEACGNTTHDFLKTEFPEAFDEVQRRLFEDGFWEGELGHWTREGRHIKVASRQVLQRDQDGRPIGILEINRDITERKEAEESLRNLSARLLQLQDEERRRIARELHDSTGQNLAALVIHLSAVTQRISTIDPSAGDILKEAIVLSQRASDEIRTLSYLLYPPTLDVSGLKSALEWYVEGFTKRSKVNVDLEVSLCEARLPQILERTLFRIVQECLTNIFRHSGSATASVRVAGTQGSVTLEVADKGKGIPPEILRAFYKSGGQLGVGMRGMRERVRQLGGWLQVCSGPGGTNTSVRLPIRESVPDESTRARVAGME